MVTTGRWYQALDTPHSTFLTVRSTGKRSGLKISFTFRESVTAYQHVIERLKLRALGFLVVDPDPIRLQVGIVTVEERRPSCRRRLGIRRGLRMELRVREQLDASCGKNE
jgi:hypothetical protein